ncbi:MAG TPA: pyruvate kinase, partial [Myxococcaceae bacterium]
MRRAKIVCTLGPASLKPEVLEEMLNAGMDVARLNFSHGSHAQHAQTLSMLRTASLKVRKGVGVLGDLQGPKIRTGKLTEGKVELVPGATFSITTDESVPGTQEL